MQICRTCPVCGIEYHADPNRLKHGRQATCSRACSYEFRGAGLTTSVTLTCATCGAEFTRPPAAIKGKYDAQFCSRSCHYAGRSLGVTKRVVTIPYVITEAGRLAHKESGKKAAITRRARNNYGKTEAERIAASEQMTNAIASGAINRVSKIEDVVAEELTRLGIGFRRQFGIRNPKTGRYCACLDFLLDDGRALEVNGTSWHADPRVYQGDLAPSQIRTAERYGRKVKLLEDLGIPLIAVWEADIRKNPQEAVALVVG